MNEYKKVRLGDVFDLQMGKTPDRNNSLYWNTKDNKWISIADISKSEKYICETKEYISNSAVKESGIKTVPKDTVVMSFKLSIGKTAITTEDCFTNEAIMAFHNNGTHEIDNNYLFHLFSNKDWSEGANKAVKGITLNKASLSIAEIPLPPIETQKQIAATLDKVTKIVAENKKLLEKYDLLIKSRFIEMFGDPVANPMGWEIKKLGEICSAIVAGWSANGTQRVKKDKELAVLKVSAVTQGFFKPNEYKVLDDQDNIKKKITPEKGDLLFSRANTQEMVGSSAVILQDYPELLLPDKLWKIRFKENANVFYVKMTISMPGIRKQFSNVSTGTSGSMFNVSMEKFKGISIPLPPLELQQQFADFVQQIDKSKFVVQQSLEKAETLYKSLMQEYFG